MSTRLLVDNLTVRYDDRAPAVLDRVQLEIPQGELLCLLGRSGSGKSTLLNAVAGFVKPESGTVWVGDTAVTGPGRDRGVVFQHDALYPWMTIERNVAVGLKALGVGRQKRVHRAHELLDLVGLCPDDVARRLPHQLSGGMRQRVGIARMLALRPRVMLMDEPFGALDAMTRLAMQDLVVTLWENLGATILFITHDVDEALRISSEIGVLGTAGAMLARHHNPLPRPRPAGTIAQLPGYAAQRHELFDLLGVDSPGRPSSAARP